MRYRCRLRRNIEFGPNSARNSQKQAQKPTQNRRWKNSQPSSVRPLNESRRTARGSAARTLRDEPVGYSGSGSNETLARSFIPIAFAAAGVRSITRSLNGPRSLILTQILHPLALFVTRTRRPHRKVLWAAVRAPSSSVPPHATWLPAASPVHRGHSFFCGRRPCCGNQKKRVPSCSRNNHRLPRFSIRSVGSDGPVPPRRAQYLI